MKLTVTGQTMDGESVFFDECALAPVEAAAFPSVQNVPVWASSEIPSLPYTGNNRTAPMPFFPPPGAFRFFYLTIRPEDPNPRTPTPDEFSKFDALFPGLLAAYEPDVPGMHTTDTVDLIAVVKGEIVLDLGTGGERTLEAGDALVQHGARHRWRNDSAEPAVLIVFMLGVDRSPPRLASIVSPSVNA